MNKIPTYEGLQGNTHIPNVFNEIVDLDLRYAKYIQCNNTEMTTLYSPITSGQPSSILNANFDSPIINPNTFKYINSSTVVPSWKFNAVLLNNSKAWGYPTPYPNGNQCVSIQNLGTISQTVNFSKGNYLISLSACGRKYGGMNETIILVTSIANKKTVLNERIKPEVNKWDKFTYELKVTEDGDYEIQFKGTNVNGDKSSALQNIIIESRIKCTKDDMDIETINTAYAKLMGDNISYNDWLRKNNKSVNAASLKEYNEYVSRKGDLNNALNVKGMPIAEYKRTLKNIENKHKHIVNLRKELDMKNAELNNINNPAFTDNKMKYDASVYSGVLWTILASSLLYYLFNKL